MTDIHMTFDESYNIDVTRTIDRIEKTGTEGNVDTYTIFYTDGATTTYTITNGRDGVDGAKGDKGDRGDRGETGPQGIQGIQGETGRRGTNWLSVSSNPTGDDTPVGPVTPAYKMLIADVLAQSGSDDVYVGDILVRAYYTYPIIYMDDLYVYTGSRDNIRGPQGVQGVKGDPGEDYILTAQDKADIAAIVEQDFGTAESEAY